VSTGTAYLDLTITDEDFDRAQGSESHSARCMIVQAIKAKFGVGARPIVDTDYIRFTNPATGDRLLYRTPPDAAAALISFDAGIRPILPLHIRARITHQTHRKSSAETEASAAKVRAWAIKQPGLAETVSDRGLVPEPVVAAFKAAHPGIRVRQGSHRVTTSSSAAGKTVLSGASGSRSAPPVGNLAGGEMGIPSSRRRTFGSRKLTTVLLEQGWTAPPSSEEAEQ
jgi:hypothetical protein